MTFKIAHLNLLKPLLSAPTAQRSSERVLKLTDIDWKKVYTLPGITTIESSPRTFQYNMLNSILHLNEKLFKFNLVESPLCSLCNQAYESLLNLFCACTKPAISVDNFVLGRLIKMSRSRLIWNHKQQYLVYGCRI